VRDPRTGLSLIDIPKEKTKAFSDLGKEMLLHIFLDVDKVTSKGKYLRRVMFITDQTLFLCEDSGGVARCFQVSQLSEVHVAQDNSNFLGFKVPSEYDMVLRFDKPEQLQDTLNVLKMVYKRMTDKELVVTQPKEIKYTSYKMSKPANFQVTIIPQRTKAHLKKSLENMEKGEFEKIKMIEAVQGELENEHKQHVSGMQKEVESVLGKLDEVTRRMKETQEQAAKHQAELDRMKRRVAEIDGQFGPNGEAPPNKDAKIREMQNVIDSMNQQLLSEQQQRSRLQQLQHFGTFAEFDSPTQLPPAAQSAPPNLVQLLQDQLAARTKELNEIDSRQRDIQFVQEQLRKPGEGSPIPPTRSVAFSPTTLTGQPAGLMSTPIPGVPSTLTPGVPSTPGVMNMAAPTANVTLPTPSTAGPQWNSGQLFDIYEQQMGRVPMNEQDLKVDPYNGLYLVDVPQSMILPFKELNGCVMYMFTFVEQMSKKGPPQKRIVILTDQTMYTCGMDGTILRCVDLRSISEIGMDEGGHIGLRITGKGEYDSFLRMETFAHASDFVTIIGTIHRQLNVQPPMTVNRLGAGKSLNPSDYQLEKPTDWVFQLHTVRPRTALMQKYNEERQRRDKERRNVEATADEYASDVIQSLRSEVRTEYASMVEAEFRQLQLKAQALENNLNDRTQEVALLRQELARHKCYDPTGKPGNRNDVTVWVPTDPLVVDCGLPILHMQLHDTILLTSHSNGFINVWNADTGVLQRTLKEHTARVTCFQYNGIDLFSGSHDTTIRRWNVQTGVCLGMLQPPHKGHVTALQFNTVVLVSGSSDCTLKVWNLVNLKCDKVLRGHKNAVSALAFEEKFLVSAEWGWIFVWDLEFGVVVKALRDDMGGINCVAVYDTKIVVGGNGADVHVWDIHSGEFVPLDGHTDDVMSAAVVDSLIVTSSTDCTIRMWNVVDLHPMGIFHNSFPIEVRGFNLSKTHFAVAESKLVKIFSR
jgi:hypothetical protein